MHTLKNLVFSPFNFPKVEEIKKYIYKLNYIEYYWTLVYSGLDETYTAIIVNQANINQILFYILFIEIIPYQTRTFDF